MREGTVQARLKAFAARGIIFLFAAASAYYALYVSSLGRVRVQMDDPDGIAGLLSKAAATMGFHGISDMLTRLGWGDFLTAFLLAAMICFCGEICFPGQKRRELRRCAARWLHPMLAGICVLWVALRLNHTSLFAWSQYLHGNHGYPLFGAARGIRLDEFGIWTPMALSQAYLGWPGINSLIGNGTDVTWISMGGLPAWNAALVFKPLYWGFLLFGADDGISFLCISRLVLLFVVSRKMALLYTKNNQSMSMAAAMMLTLSPMTQWFISQSIAEVLIFGQGMVLSVYEMLHRERTRDQILYGLLTFWLLGCLIMVGYPAWMIPTVYLALAAWIYLFTRPIVQNRGKKLRNLLIASLPFLAMLAIVVYNSWDTLQMVAHSLYPGSRLITGGLQDSHLITGGVWNSIFKIDLASIFSPLENLEFNYSNPVDAATFLGFAPAGLILSIDHWRQQKRMDPVAILLISMMAFFWLFTFVPLPAWFCKITLLSQCSRPTFLLGVCEVILLVRARASGGMRDQRLAIGAVLVSAAMNLGGILYFGLVRPGTLQLMILAALYLFIFSMIYFDFPRVGNRLTAFFLCCVMLLAGGFVNPVQQGLDMLDDYELVSALKEIPNDPEDLYALEGVYPVSNIPLLAGKRCINTDQPYADLDRWSAIDPEGKHQEVYNRLCHVAISLAEEDQETEFLEDGNYIWLRLTREDLEKLGVNYLITPRGQMQEAELIAELEEDELYIWKLR